VQRAGGDEIVDWFERTGRPVKAVFVEGCVQWVKNRTEFTQAKKKTILMRRISVLFTFHPPDK
jgi:hypothetical protein